MSKIVAVICVRMGSERLPGKMMLEAAGKPLLGHLISRIQQVEKIDEIVIATAESPENDVIEQYCKEVGVSCFRGSEEDVLGRMLGALKSVDAEIGVEVYGDEPLIDPRIITHCIDTYLEGGFDWVGNDVRPGFPSGMFSEVFSVKALEDAASRTEDKEFREHGTLFLRHHPDLYKQHHIEAEGNQVRPEVHLDIDNDVDFAVFEAIIEHFAPRTDFSMEEILTFLDEHPDIRESNTHTERKWKQYQRTA